MKKTVLRPLSFISSLIVFITLSTVLARSVAAADLTLQITPNTVSATGLLTSTVELQNTAGVFVQRYEIVLSPDSTVVGPASVSVTSTSPLNQPVLESVDNTTGNVAFSRYDDTGGKNSNPIPVGRITLTVTNTSANPLFTVVTATAYGKDASGQRTLTIDPGTNVPPIPTQPGGGGLPTGPTATRVPTATRGPSIPACNLCGYCLGGPIPDDYGECVQCLYANPGSTTDPSTNQPTNPNDGVQWTVFGCMQSDAGNYTNQLVKVATAVIGGITFLVILYGGFLVLTSSGDPEKLNRGKGLVKSGIIAGIIVLFAVVILQTAGLKILQVPGF